MKISKPRRHPQGYCVDITRDDGERMYSAFGADRVDATLRAERLVRGLALDVKEQGASWARRFGKPRQVRA